MLSCYPSYVVAGHPVIDLCLQCDMMINHRDNDAFCDDLCRRLHDDFSKEDFRKNREPKDYRGTQWSWVLTPAERKSAEIYFKGC